MAVNTAEIDLSNFLDGGRLSRGATLIALSATVLIHLAVILALPDEIMHVGIADKKEAAVNREYEINLVTPEEMRFVEANPEVVENVPDRTEQYSFKNQQAADDSPTQDAKNMPKVEGEENSQKIIQGSLEKTPPIEPGVYSPTTAQGEGEGDHGGKLGSPSETTQVPVSQPLPTPDFIQQKPISEEGPGSRIEPIGEAREVFEKTVPDAPIDIYQQQPDTTEVTQITDGGGGGAKPAPRVRPRLAPELITGPLMNSPSSASRRGSIAIDATFSEFGEYEQQFYAAIQTGWYQEIEFFQPIDTASRVHVRLTIHSDGKVTEVKAVHTTASEIATLICENAITKRSPFRPWTREMVKVFGDKRTLNIMFHYR